MLLSRYHENFLYSKRYGMFIGDLLKYLKENDYQAPPMVLQEKEMIDMSLEELEKKIRVDGHHWGPLRPDIKEDLVKEFPEHMIILSEVYWKMVESLKDNNFPIDHTMNIVNSFFKIFRPLSKKEIGIEYYRKKE